MKSTRKLIIILLIMMCSVHTVRVNAVGTDSFVIGIHKSRTPYEAYEDKVAKGIMIDYLKLMATKTGLNFEYVVCKSHDEIQKKLETGEIHMAISLTDSNDEHRKMSQCCIKETTCIVINSKTNKTYESDINKIINSDVICAMVEDEYSHEENTGKDDVKQYRIYENYRDCMDAVKRGEAGYAIIPEMAVTKLKEHSFYDELVVIPYGEAGIYICVSDICPDSLMNFINEGISQINNEEKEEIIFENLYKSKEKAELRDVIADNKVLFMISVTVLIIIMIFILIHKFKMEDADKIRNIPNFLLLYNKFTDSENIMESKKMFLAKLGHDIKNPMNAIMGLTERAIENVNDPEAVVDYLKDIKSSGNYLVNLTDNIMDLTKSIDGKLVLKKETVDLHEAIAEINAIVNRQANEKKLTYIVNDNIEENLIVADKGRIQQVIINLLINSVKYTKEGGKVILDICSKRINNKRVEVYLEVSDTGIGISEEFKMRLFEPFTRENRYEKDAGFGLGMNIVKELVSYMDGDIKVKSKIGKGTKVSVELNFDIAKPKKNSNLHINGMNVLVADDSDINLQLISEFLSAYGMNIHKAHNGSECLKMYLESIENYYQFIIADINMPDITGDMVAKTIRESGRMDTCKIKIIGLTAEEPDNDEILKYMDGCILKPIAAGKVISYLESFASEENKKI